QRDSFWTAIFELYRFGENEYWITAENVNEMERQIILNVSYNQYDVMSFGSSPDSEFIRETLSGQTFLRKEILPEIYNICEKYQPKNLGINIPILCNYEINARRCAKEYYKRQGEQNVVQTPLEGPSDHFWLRGFDRTTYKR
ncbi:hypothetical protein PFISCL1PPCAC_7381, partial [Pristionchus fissidentatus]